MHLSSTTIRRLRLAGIYTGVAILLFWALAPIYWIVVSSISTRLDLYQTPTKVWFPSPPTFEHYLGLFQGGEGFRGGQSEAAIGALTSGLTNSLVSSVGTAIIVTLLCPTCFSTSQRSCSVCRSCPHETLNSNFWPLFSRIETASV
jgi:ABC-type glycerol-3-phosphate transport system permease component